MRRTGAVLTITAVLLTGCASATSGGPTSGFHIAQVAPSPPTTGATVATIERVGSAPIGEVDWTVRPVDPAVRSIDIDWTDGGSPECGEADRVRVFESATTIVVAVVDRHRSTTVLCTAEGHARSMRIPLRSSLGGRALIESVTVNDGLPHTADPTVLPAPTCRSDAVRDAPVGFAAAASLLAPRGASRALICRTSWPHGSVRVTSRMISDSETVARLIDALDARAAGPHAGRPADSCDVRNGSWFDVHLLSSDVRVQVHVDEFRCTVDNGAAGARTTPALEAMLERLVPAAR